MTKTEMKECTLAAKCTKICQSGRHYKKLKSFFKLLLYEHNHLGRNIVCICVYLLTVNGSKMFLYYYYFLFYFLFFAVIRKLNELYKNCVTYCRSLSDQLQTFLLNKQKLMDNFNALTAEKLIYNHTVHMVSSFHSNIDIHSKMDSVLYMLSIVILAL